MSIGRNPIAPLEPGVQKSHLVATVVLLQVITFMDSSLTMSSIYQKLGLNCWMFLSA